MCITVGSNTVNIIYTSTMAIRYWVSTSTKHLMHLIANIHRRAGNWGSAMWNHLPRTIQLVSDSQHQAQVCVSPDVGSFHSAISFYCRSQSVVVMWKRHDHGQKEGSGQVKKVVKVQWCCWGDYSIRGVTLTCTHLKKQIQALPLCLK